MIFFFFPGSDRISLFTLTPNPPGIWGYINGDFTCSPCPCVTKHCSFMLSVPIIYVSQCSLCSVLIYWLNFALTPFCVKFRLFKLWKLKLTYFVEIIPSLQINLVEFYFIFLQFQGYVPALRLCSFPFISRIVSGSTVKISSFLIGLLRFSLRL